MFIYIVSVAIKIVSRNFTETQSLTLNQTGPRLIWWGRGVLLLFKRYHLMAETIEFIIIY